VIGYTSSALGLGLLFIFIMIVDKRCDTIPIMLITNSCLTAFILESDMLDIDIFTLENDLKQISYEDFFCIFRGYISLFNFSFVLEALYRYIIVVYPNRLFFQSARFQGLFICLTWIFGIL